MSTGDPVNFGNIANNYYTTSSIPWTGTSILWTGTSITTNTTNYTIAPMPVNGGLPWITSPTTYYTINPMVMSPINLNLSSTNNMLSLAVREITKNILYKQMQSFSTTYDRYSTTYVTLVENDLESKVRNSTQIADFYAVGRSLMVIAFDKILNRLELSTVYKQDEPVSNIDSLLDDQLQVRENKEEYFKSLRSRFLPLVNYKPLSFSEDSVSFEKNINGGLFPVIHVSNYVYNPLNSKSSKKDTPKASTLFDSLTQEAFLLNKEELPAIQPRFSPEYGYLTLRSKKEVEAALSKYDKSMLGLVSLLRNSTIPGTNVIPFIESVVDQCALDQNIVNTEEFAYITLRHLLETNL